MARTFTLIGFNTQVNAAGELTEKVTLGKEKAEVEIQEKREVCHSSAGEFVAVKEHVRIQVQLPTSSFHLG